jgi:NAD(P)-dependent dehydrogenase (short-subunit alcohol dehydrogenase family)
VTATETFRLDGRVAVVTGGGRGLGQAMALALAQAGADVAVVGRTAASLEETAAAVRAAGRRALTVTADVTASRDVERAVETIHRDLGRLDVLVNNSGIAAVRPVAEMAEAEWRAILDTNLTGAFLLCRAVAPHMIAARRGKVINVSSVLATRMLPGYAAYSASKAGLVALTRILALEWARHNIQVNAIAPGWFVTPMNAQAFADPVVRDRLLRDVPARRTGRPEELGPLVVYLASPASDYVTGETVSIDGGLGAS